MCVHVFFLVDETIGTNMVAGILSGAISSAVANPTDVLKVVPIYQGVCSYIDCFDSNCDASNTEAVFVINGVTRRVSCAPH